MKLRFKYLYILAIYIFIICISYTPKRAYSYFFEDFSGKFDNENTWDTYNSSGISFSLDSINLTSASPKSFPYIKSKYSLIDSLDKVVRVSFKYNDAGINFGDGFAISDINPEIGTVMTYPKVFSQYTMFYVWHTPSNPFFHIVTFLCPNNNTACIEGSPTVIYQSNSRDLNSHLIEFKIESNVYSLFLDNVELFTSNPTNRVARNIWIGNPEYTLTSGVWASLSIDYIEVGDKPSSLPYLSQKDTAWGSEEYDSASSWAGLDKSGIDRWGCALTSAAMILQKYEVKTVSGDNVTPDNLNTWLKAQPDGYIGPGLLNWLAVTRFAKNSFDVGQASTKLEYERSYLPSSMTLPAILSTGSHFVVAHSEDLTNWNINDPANESKKQLPKTTNIKSINRFIPSNTDLSYMMFSSEATVSATLKDEAGQMINIDWQGEYLSDDVSGDNNSQIYIGIVPKPINGKYTLEVEKPGEATTSFNIYLYDLDGKTTPQEFILNDSKNKFEIDYSNSDQETSEINQIDITPPPIPTLISPENNAYKNTFGLVLDWADETDESMPVTYNYKSTWNGGAYGPVSTSTNSFITANGTPDNTYQWYVQACDSAKNCSDWASRTLLIDSSKPSVDLVFPLPGPSSNYFEAVFTELVNPVEATNGANYFLTNWPGAGGSGDLLGDANITYEASNKTARIIFTNPGWYISSEQLWGVQNISDLAGNVLSQNPYSKYSTPLTPPTLNSAPTSTPNPTPLTTQDWSWLPGGDIGSGIKGYSTKTYDVITQQYLSDWLWMGKVLGTSTSLGEGQWQLSLQATDNAGNVSEINTSEVLSVDTTPPSSPINLHFDNPSLSCGSFTNSKFVTIDWDDATDNQALLGYEYNIDYPNGAKRGSWTTFFTTSSYRGSLNEGTHYIKLRAKDKAGNYSTWSNSCSITYDSVAPKLIAKTEFAGWYNKIQTSYFDFEDENMMISYLAPWCEISSSGTNQTCSINPNVCDKANNCYITPLTSNPINIDLIRPIIDIKAWGSTINGTASDTLSGLDKIELKITRPEESELVVTATGTNNWSYTMSDTKTGHYKVIATAYDKAGNASIEAGKEFDMSPANNEEGQVQGASTNEPILEKNNPEIEKIDKIEIIPLATEQTKVGSVLGEEVEQTKNSWWIIIYILGGSLLIGILIYLIKKKL